MGAETQRAQGSLDLPHSPGGADRSPWPRRGLTQLPQDSVLGAPKAGARGLLRTLCLAFLTAPVGRRSWT